ALDDLLSFELCERREHVALQPPRSRCTVERLIHRHQGDAVVLEVGDKRRQVTHRAAESVELRHDDTIDGARAAGGDEPIQFWPAVPVRYSRSKAPRSRWS